MKLPSGAADVGCSFPNIEETCLLVSWKLAWNQESNQAFSAVRAVGHQELSRMGRAAKHSSPVDGSFGDADDVARCWFRFL